MDNIASFLGLILRAGRLAVGEEPVLAACMGHKASLLLLAQDAADNTIRRASHYSETGNALCLTLPMNKVQLGEALGRASCAVVAVTEIGFASALTEKLAQLDPTSFHDAHEMLRKKAQRAKKRKSPQYARAKAERRSLRQNSDNKK